MKLHFQGEEGPEVRITLTAKDPQAPQNKIVYDHATQEFIKITLTDTMIDHLEIESTILHKDSEEAKKQMKEKEDSMISKSQNLKLIEQIIKFRFPIVLENK